MIWGQDLWELFLKGGPVMWPLLLCSIVGAALIIERSIVIAWSSAGFHALVNALRPLVRAGKQEEAVARLDCTRGPVARVAAVYLHHAASPQSLRDDVVAREISQQVAFLDRRLSWLGLIAQVTPLLGLLGTVLGLMTAFHEIDIKGAPAADLSLGIWQKLLNTAFGLAIAVPCLVAYYWLDRRVSVLGLQMEWITSHLNEWLGTRPGTRHYPDGHENYEIPGIIATSSTAKVKDRAER